MASKSRSSRPIGEDGELGESRMDQLAWNDRDIAELLEASLARPVSSKAQAFYDRMFELTHGKGGKPEEVATDLSDVA
ncbi:hypothetical protein CR152_01285 [Massilia violaceinigra]|uniref:Uncharacterized protein n=2 Tax=Massilia violaceinigra TaxID=2045208 RepID=A0A2D2DED4_9BURK|nr:hypothetical protein CR152_01285 [Massilia violaceinigra]